MDPVCGNPCECGEVCFAGFTRPDEECGTNTDVDTDADTDTDSDTDTDTDTDTDADTNADTDKDTDSDTESCPEGLTACPNGDADCVYMYETCAVGCCYPRCEEGVMPCFSSADCESGFMCVTGCCIVSAPVI